MASCPLCHRDPREDDELATVQTALHGMVGACRGCRRDLTGQDVPDPVYPPGRPVPTIYEGPTRRHLRVCGVCRKALRFGDADKAIRLEREDLCEVFQAAYTAEVGPARQAFHAAVEAADAAYAAAVAPLDQELGERLAELRRQAQAAKLSAEQHCESANQWASAESTIDAGLQREEGEAARAYDLAAAPAAAARNAARFRAEREYRKAAVAAMQKVASVLESDRPICEPGAYAACGECYERYGGRVRERHVRTFVKTGHHLL